MLPAKLTMPAAGAPLTNMITSPSQYASASTADLLKESALGRVPFDRRLAQVLIDRAPQSVPDLVHAALDPPKNARMFLSFDIFHLLRHLRTPDAIPVYIDLLHGEDDEDPDEIYEALAELGAHAIEPLLALYREKGPKHGGNAAFLLSSLGTHDPRITTILTDRLAVDPWDAALCLSLYGDPATKPAIEAKLATLDPEKDAEAIKELKLAFEEIGNKLPVLPHPPYDAMPAFAEIGEPEFEAMELREILDFLSSTETTYRALAVEALGNEELSPENDKRILEVAKNDTEVEVRAAAWQALATSPGREVRNAIRDKAKDTAAPPIERAAALAAATITEYNPEIQQLAEELYEIPEARAMALKAMWQTLRSDFNEYFPKHLEDPDPEIRRQAIWGVGYLGMGAQAARLEGMFDDEDFRDHALFAYALCVPGTLTKGTAKSVYRKIDDLAGGLSEEEQEAVESALDQRLQMHGHEPVFMPVEEHVHDENCGHDHGHSHAKAAVEPAKALSKTAGRNDPCPCGSGKKFKKCCGA